MQEFGVASESGRPDALDVGRHPFEHARRSIDETASSRIRYSLHENQVAHATEEVRGEPARIVARLDNRLHHPEQGGTVRVRERVDRGVDERRIGGSEQAQCPLILDPFVSGTREQLVENAERVHEASRRRRE